MSPNDVSLRYKFAGVLAVPLLALAAVSWMGVEERRQQVASMREVRELAQASVAIGGIVHELQRERGLSSGFLSSGGARFGGEVSAQRQATDQRLQALDRLIDGAAAAGESRRVVGQARAALVALSELRGRVTGLRLQAPDAIDEYARLISALLDSFATISGIASDPTVARAASAHRNLVQAKERAGIERATLTAAFTAGQFSPRLFRGAIAQATAQELYLRQFAETATAEQRSTVEHEVNGAVGERVSGLRSRALERSVDERLDVDPQEWFQAATDRIDRLKSVEDLLAEGLSAAARRAEAGAALEMRTYLGLAGTALFVALALAIVLSVSLLRSFGQALHVARRLAEGDLTTRIEVRSRDEAGQLLEALQQTLRRLADVIQQIRGASSNLTAASAQVSETAQVISQSASQQAAVVEETSASMEEISAAVARTSSAAHDTNQTAANVAKEAAEGGEAVRQTLSTMHAIAGRAEELEEFAFQTHLLALNATIEAPQAGEKGRGFAVVAAEVRKLAERSRVASNEIGQLMREGVTRAETAGVFLESIVPQVGKTSTLIKEVSTATAEQTQGNTQVSEAVSRLSQTAQENASASEELAATAEELSAHAESLDALVGFFRTPEDPPLPARPRPAVRALRPAA